MDQLYGQTMRVVDTGLTIICFDVNSDRPSNKDLIKAIKVLTFEGSTSYNHSKTMMKLNFDLLKCLTQIQCDQSKVTKHLLKLPKKGFTRKMKDFDTFSKIA